MLKFQQIYRISLLILFCLKVLNCNPTVVMHTNEKCYFCYEVKVCFRYVGTELRQRWKFCLICQRQHTLYTIGRSCSSKRKVYQTCPEVFSLVMLIVNDVITLLGCHTSNKPYTTDDSNFSLCNIVNFIMLVVCYIVSLLVLYCGFL